MSAKSKHSYRFGFLKSEPWKSLRVACLARDGAACWVCGRRSLSNDVHHVRYRKSWNKTKLCDLRTLCREHHKAVHELMKMFPNHPAYKLVTRMKKDFYSFKHAINSVRWFHFRKNRTLEQFMNYQGLVQAAASVAPKLTKRAG